MPTIIIDKFYNNSAQQGLLDDVEVIGGYKVVQTLDDLDALKSIEVVEKKHILTNGCPVYVAVENATYRWNATTKQFDLDETGGSEFTGQIDDQNIIGGYKVVETYDDLRKLKDKQTDPNETHTLKNGCAVYVATGDEKGLYYWVENNEELGISQTFVKDGGALSGVGYIVVQNDDDFDTLKTDVRVGRMVIQLGCAVYVTSEKTIYRYCEVEGEDGTVKNEFVKESTFNKHIINASINAHSELVLTYSDGSTEAAGVLKVGNAGDFIYNADEESIEEKLSLAVEFTITGSSVTLDETLYADGICIVDWGDGVQDNQASHTYEDDGEHIIKFYSNTEELGKLPNTVTSAVVGGKITKILNEAFSFCNSLTEVVLPYGLKEIGNRAFYGCTSLQECLIPHTVKTIGDQAFVMCKLPNVILGDNILSIGESVFERCDVLRSITLSKTLKLIPHNAFKHCKSLKTVVIPDGVEVIGSYAFYGCESLVQVTVGATVSEIEGFAFGSTESLNNIKFNSEIPPTIAGDLFYANSQSCNIIVPGGSENLYKTAWSDYADYVYDESSVVIPFYISAKIKVTFEEPSTVANPTYAILYKSATVNVPKHKTIDTDTLSSYMRRVAFSLCQFIFTTKCFGFGLYHDAAGNALEIYEWIPNADGTVSVRGTTETPKAAELVDFGYHGIRG